MDNKTLKLHIKKYVQLQKLHLTGDKNHIHIIAIGEVFNGIKNIQRQKMIYKPLTPYIIEKKIHAVTIDVFTPQEWEKSKTKIPLNLS